MRNRALVDGNRIAKTQGAAERVRLPHAHLRQPFPVAPTASCVRATRPSTLPPFPEADWRDPHVVVTPSTYGTDNPCTLDAMARLGPAHMAWRWLTPASPTLDPAPAPLRRSGHPLQPRPVRRDDHRHARAAIEARQPSRLACVQIHMWPTRSSRQRPSCNVCRPDRIRPHAAHSSTGRHRSSGFRAGAQAPRSRPDLGELSVATRGAEVSEPLSYADVSKVA